MPGKFGCIESSYYDRRVLQYRCSLPALAEAEIAKSRHLQKLLGKVPYRYRTAYMVGNLTLVQIREMTGAKRPRQTRTANINKLLKRGWSNAKIGRVLGVSRQRVHQLHNIK